MSCMNADTKDAWQAIADEASMRRPSVGRKVIVTGGRKHKGKSGVVIRHQISRYCDPFRYASEAQAHMREMVGRFGFVCLVHGCTGETFWVNAEYVEVAKQT